MHPVPDIRRESRKSFLKIEQEGFSAGEDEWWTWESIETLTRCSEVYKNARVFWFKRVFLIDKSDKICLVKTREGRTATNQQDVVIPPVDGFKNGKAFFEMNDGWSAR